MAHMFQMTTDLIMTHMFQTTDVVNPLKSVITRFSNDGIEKIKGENVSKAINYCGKKSCSG